MDQDLKKLQFMVQDQISKANAFKRKMSVQVEHLNFDKDDLERKLSTGAPDDAILESRAFGERPGSKGVVFDNRLPLRSGMTMSSLPTLNTFSSYKTGTNTSVNDLHDSHLHGVKTEGSTDSSFKITIPKIRKKTSQSSSSTSLGSVRYQPKNRPAGKIKRVNVHSFPMPESDEHERGGGSVSPQLIHDIGEAFKGIYTRQKLQPIQTEKNVLSPSSNTFRSRVRTPPELVSDEFTQSEVLLSSFMNSVTDIERKFEETRAFDPTMNMNVRELTTIVNKEKRSFDSLALYVQTKYIEVKEHEKASGGDPTRLKTAVCADLLTKLCYGLGQYAPIIEPLLWELLNSIFDDFKNRETVFNRENFLSELFRCKSYFELYHEAHDALEDISDELEVIQQGMRLKDIVKKFQTVRLAFNEQQGFIRDICFKAWKILWKRGRRLKRLARQKGLRYRWTRWRLFVKKREEREIEDYSNELDKKIQKLIELNNLIANQSTNETNRESDSTRRSMISFGTGSLIDPAFIPSPIDTSITNATGSPNRPLSISEKMTLAGNISRRVSKNFETVTIATTPSMRKMMSSRMNSMARLRSQSIDENSSNLEPSLEPSAEDVEMVTALEQAVKLSQELAVQYQDEGTQTPDEWMHGVNESNLASGLSTSKSFNLRDSMDLSYLAESKDSNDGAYAAGGAGRRSSMFRYSLNVRTAGQIIAFIYENRYGDMLVDSSKDDFSSTIPLLQYSKQLLLKRYSLRRIAEKFYRGIITVCTRESVSNKRLELFGVLAGIPLADRADTSYDNDRCTFFFKILSVLFQRRLDALANVFALQEIDRSVILTAMPEIFTDLQEKDVDFYQNIIYDLVDLSSTDPASIDKVYKVDIDEALLILMDAYETKYKKPQGPEDKVGFQARIRI